MIKLTLTITQRKVIREICSIEIEAITQLLNELPNDESMLLIEQHEGATTDDYYEKLAKWRTQFFTIDGEPERLFELDEDAISLFRHILWNLDQMEEKTPDCVTVKYPIATKNLWRKLFTMDDFPELTKALTLSN